MEKPGCVCGKGQRKTQPFSGHSHRLLTTQGDRRVLQEEYEGRVGAQEEESQVEANSEGRGSLG